MPFYEYKCGACGHHLEALQKFSDEPLVYCPECNAPSLKKMISAAAFRLKGTGWYETDFKGDKKDGGKTAGSAGTDKSASDKSPSGTSSESGENKSKSTDSSSKETPSKSSSAASASA